MSNRKLVAVMSLALSTVILLASCNTPGTSPEAQGSTGTVEETPTFAGAHGAAQPTETTTPRPTRTPYPTETPRPTATLTPTPTATPTVPPATETAVPTNVPAARPASTQVPASASPLVELERIPDADPAPPITILVDAIRIKADGYYKMTGRVRNDGSGAYEGVGVRASFLDDKRRGYGAVEVYCPCRVVEPGAECPFSLKAFPHNYIAYRLHPFGRPVMYHVPASLTLGALDVSSDGLGNVRIAGTATNANAFTVRDAVVAGTLVDAAGRVVSVGSTWLLGDTLPGDSRSFVLYIEYEPYARYQLSAQGIQK